MFGTAERQEQGGQPDFSHCTGAGPGGPLAKALVSLEPQKNLTWCPWGRQEAGGKLVAVDYPPLGREEDKQAPKIGEMHSSAVKGWGERPA